MNPWWAFLFGVVLGIVLTFAASLMFAASRGREHEEGHWDEWDRYND
jgi:gas vesicle protein